MEKQKKSVGTTILVVLLLIATVASLIFATYVWAKYSSTQDASASATVAKWNVTASNTDLAFAKEFKHVITPNKLAPGTNGSFSAKLDVTGTEVDVAYTVTIENIENQPTNLVLKDSKGNKLTKGSTITGTITTGSTTKTAEEVITWEWPYETGTSEEDKKANDVKDTTDGTNAKTMTITYKIDAVQVQPE